MLTGPRKFRRRPRIRCSDFLIVICLATCVRFWNSIHLRSQLKLVSSLLLGHSDRVNYFSATNAGYKSSDLSALDTWVTARHHFSVIGLFRITTEVNQQKLFVFWWGHKTIHCSLLCQKGIASCKGVVIHYFYRTFFSLASFKFFAPCYKKGTTMESKHSLTVVSQKRKTWTPILTKRWIFIYLFIFFFITASLIIGLQDRTVGIEQHETRVAGHFPATWPCHCP